MSKHQSVTKAVNIHENSYLSFSLSISASNFFLEDRDTGSKEGPAMMLSLVRKQKNVGL